MSKTTRCTASVWPHRHTDEFTGPLDVIISYRNQPQVVRDWPQKRPIRVCLEQPDEQTNLTILKMCFGYHSKETWNRASQYLKGKGRTRKIYIRGRITKQMDHPIPRGQWEGTFQYNEDWCLYTFQAMTAKVTKKKSIIILPGEDGL